MLASPWEWEPVGNGGKNPNLKTYFFFFFLSDSPGRCCGVHGWLLSLFIALSVFGEQTHVSTRDGHGSPHSPSDYVIVV